MIPVTDSKLVPYTTNFNDRIVAMPADFALTAAQAAAYTPLNTAYLAAVNTLHTSRADGTQSQSLTATRNATKNALLAYARQLYTFVQANSTVTDANKILLGVTVRKTTPSPIPAPTARPSMDIQSVTARTVSVGIHDGAVSNHKKPKGAVAAFVYTYVGTSYPSDPTAWQFYGPATKSSLDVVFPDSVANGAQVWVCCAWASRRGETGPVSQPISTNIQGGGVSASSMKIAA